MSDFNIDKIRNVILQFKIPMAFDVLNCIKKEDKGKSFLVAIDNIPARISIKRIYEFRYRDEGFKVAPFSKIGEDRGGMLSHSLVQVWFDRQTIDSGKIDKSLIRILPNQFIDLSIDYLNKFIKTYKHITNEYWLRPLIHKDIFNISYLLRDTANNTEHINLLIPSHQTVQFNGGKEFKLEDKTEEYFRSLLTSDAYSFEKEYLLNLTDNFSLGYFNIALVQAVTLFESFIYTHLKQCLSNTKLDKIKKKDECGCMAGISEVCERGLVEHFKLDFGSTEEYTNLKESALKYRNLIVHGELLQSIDKPTCEKALNTVKAAQVYLHEHLFSKFQENKT